MAITAAPADIATRTAVEERLRRTRHRHRQATDLAGMIRRGRSRAAIEVTPFDIDRTRVAFDAWGRFGEGRHPAGLNLGGCFAYATSGLADAALLFMGTTSPALMSEPRSSR